LRSWIQDGASEEAPEGKERWERKAGFGNGFGTFWFAAQCDCRANSKWDRHVEKAVHCDFGSRRTFCLSEWYVNIPRIPDYTDVQVNAASRKLSPEQLSGNLESTIDSDLAGSTTAAPRLQRSLQRLNESVAEFEKIYATHADMEVGEDGWDDALSNILNGVQLTDDMFDNATALENKINQTLIRREELKEQRSRRKSMSRYIANVFPLLKFLVDVGGMAAQVKSVNVSVLIPDGGLCSGFDRIACVRRGCWGMHSDNCAICWNYIGSHNGG
jgi:hypothetical protein